MGQNPLPLQAYCTQFWLSQPIAPAPYGPGGVLPGGMGDANQPTRVVGSRGRRGIRPSAPGRPAATPAGAGNTKSPVKGADGRFRCPQCPKTFLHESGVRRHDTGDRPYRCVLCGDTFSRSDILKEHFQKCSIRRGNPTGASHLSDPRARVKKAGAQNAAAGQDGDLNHPNANTPADDMAQPFGMMPVSDGMNNLGGSNSNQQSGLGRSQISRLTQIATISEPNTDAESMERPPSHQNQLDSLFFSTWDVPSSIHDPFSHLSNQILNFVYPPGFPIDDESTGLNQFSAENVRQFLGNFTYSHDYNPILYTTTIMEAYTGLLVGMCCMGAYYSRRVSLDHMRDMMILLRSALARDVLLATSGKQQSGNADAGASSNGHWGFEKVEALRLLQILQLRLGS
ncbi:hypothetical protein CORC01_10815 [Colletotrichum orchidophilum]|uniref:C2H2-type domain-containing protein n=1 Tax=Colletotrichum orchidophilum TaxID=1209926 RepID=A0A1G4AXR7_9PEZI|nr:uncharacterized protein CORC01_10815 [Colletotrichum orchidophilum]OHE93916.1 hypothetical protein CORC01_10815 [Colletotrichum orchidophilum]